MLIGKSSSLLIPKLFILLFYFLGDQRSEMSSIMFIPGSAEILQAFRRFVKLISYHSFIKMLRFWLNDRMTDKRS